MLISTTPPTGVSAPLKGAPKSTDRHTLMGQGANNHRPLPKAEGSQPSTKHHTGTNTQVEMDTGPSSSAKVSLRIEVRG